MVRKSPTQSATLYKMGTKKNGNDGNIWIVMEASNGVKRWKLFKKPTTILIKKTLSKKKSTKLTKAKRNFRKKTRTYRR